MRTSFTSVVREAGPLSAGLFDRRGRMVAQAVTGTPGHVNAMATSAHHFLEAFPVETLRPGDALVTNHPWQTSRSEEHTSELQSRQYLVCRLLLEKKTHT